MTVPVPDDGSRPDIDRAVIDALLGHATSDAEWERLQQLLDLLWLAAVDAKPCPEAYLRPTWTAVLAEAAIRKFRNPSDLTMESQESYSYTRAAGSVAGSMASLSPDELAGIWGGCPDNNPGIFTIQTAVRGWP